MTQLKRYCIVLLVLLQIPLFINILILNNQCDPFVPTTMVIGKYIEEYGSIDTSRQFFIEDFPTYSWQDHTKDYLLFTPLSGVLVYIISSITNIPISTITYLPIPYIICCGFLICFIKLTYALAAQHIKPFRRFEHIFIAASLACGIYAFIGQNVIGKFYIFEYHGIYFVYILATYYLILKIVSTGNKLLRSRLVIPLIIIFVANLFTHYNFSLTITGGLAIFIIIYWSMIKINTVKSGNLYNLLLTILVLFIILLTFQNFYYTRLSHAGSILDLGPAFLNLMIDKITNPESAGTITQSIYHYGNYLILFNKYWHLSFIGLTSVIFCSLIYFSRKTKFYLPLFSFILALILGRNIVWAYSYFTQYRGSFSLQLIDSWILVILIVFALIPLLMTQNVRWKNIGVAFALCLLISNVFLIGWASLEAEATISGYGAFPHQIKENANSLYEFLLKHEDGEKKIISGSIQATSGLYEHMCTYPFDNLQHIIPISSYYYITDLNKGNKEITEIYHTLETNNINSFIITDYELNNGLYGGLTSSPLNATEVQSLSKILDQHTDRIYNSHYAYLNRFS